MATAKGLYSIVLAAGKGRRMRAGDKHKVCFEIAGVPAIVRAVEAYNRLGVVQNIVVVGERSGQVVETLGRRFSNIVFVYQREARGTGDAARCGLQALAAIDDDARILLVAGDKLVDGGTLLSLLAHFERTGSDLAMLVSPAEIAGASAGRVLFRPDGSPLAIVELPDIKRLQCRTELLVALQRAGPTQVDYTRLEQIAREHLGPGQSWTEAVDSRDGHGLLSLDQDGLITRLQGLPREFRVGPERLPISAEEALRSRFRNEFVYLVRKGALGYGMNHMSLDNAQAEEYLTDALGAILSAQGERRPRFRSSFLATESPGEVMSYNNPEELLAIEDRLQGQRRRAHENLAERLGSERFRTAQQWLELFSDDGERSATDEALGGYYGNDPELLLERRRAYRGTLLRFCQTFGPDRQLILVRSPGRINIMGRHIDWQGGHCNLMAVNQEVIMAVAPRADDRLEIRNVQPDRFPDASISLGRLVSELDWDDWLSCVNSQELQRRLRQAAGHWSIYIEAAMLRLQMEFRQQMLLGMDMVVNGNIPVAAGMSSSSALVVSAAEAAVSLNGLDLMARQFVNFCGEGEWFVGTRGGSADHAAMKFGSKSSVIHVKFHDFELVERVQFPDSHRMVVCNSFIEAKKAEGARAVFNSRVASYLLGVALVRQHYPQHAPFIRFVRDIDPDNLHVAAEQIYRILLRLPESMSTEAAREALGDDPDTLALLAPHFESPDAPKEYPVRGVMLFGISECARARQAISYLKKQDMAALGQLMNTSHDGERCFRVDDHLNAKAFHGEVSDSYLQGLLDDLESNDPSRIQRAQLYRQPGAYRSSTREIDALVDIATRTDGVLGAQIAGAGLGGCAMVLAQSDAVPELQRRLMELFYNRNGLASGVSVCTPAAGSCVVAVEA